MKKVEFLLGGIVKIDNRVYPPKVYKNGTTRGLRVFRVCRDMGRKPCSKGFASFVMTAPKEDGDEL